MVVSLRTALHAHLAVAESLTGLWVQLPYNDRKLIHDEMGRWRNPNHTHTSADAHLAYLCRRFDGEITPAATNALLSANCRGEEALQEIYADVRTHVSALYGTHTSVDTRGIAPLQVDVQEPAIFQDEIIGGFGASGMYGPDPQTGRPSLVLTVCPKFMGPRTLASISYVLCHELVCHALQGAPNNDEDSFAEGWMDRVALSLHDSWSAQLFPSEPQLACDAAHELCTYLRADTAKQTDSYGKTRDARRLGWAAAGHVERFLQLHGAGSAVPTLFQLLSMQLNVLPDFSVVRRRAFVTEVRAAQKELTRNTRLSTALLRWKEEQINASELVSSIIDL